MFYRTSSLLGPLPCFPSLQLTITQSRAKGIADHILPLGDLLTLQSEPPLNCRWTVIQSIFSWKATKMLNLTQNRDIHCRYLFQSLWKCLIVLYFFIILLNISVHISSEKCNIEKKRRGGQFWRGAFFWKNMVCNVFTYFSAYFTNQKSNDHTRRPLALVGNTWKKTRLYTQLQKSHACGQGQWHKKLTHVFGLE